MAAAYHSTGLVMILAVGLVTCAPAPPVLPTAYTTTINATVHNADGSAYFSLYKAFYDVNKVRCGRRTTETHFSFKDKSKSHVCA